MSEEWNESVYGKCNHPNWHGHNYVLEVTVAGEPDPQTGFVVDLGRLSQVIDERIVTRCDHRNLNLDVDFLQGVIPTTENLAKAFFMELQEFVEKISSDGSKLISVRLYETERNVAEYRP
jgi:6-pyruvoyltetrahydropterin/6-carboxytetrahydropterin synthase